MSASAFTVIIPSRLSSTRLPSKALADIHGKPMVVRVAERARQSAAGRVIVATDHTDIQAACTAHGIDSILTDSAHQSGSTRLAEAVQILGLPENEIIVNVQGDEPMIPSTLIDRVAQKLADSDAPMATAAHPVHDFAEFQNPNCVKVVLSQAHNALYFSRAPIAYPRDIMQSGDFRLPVPAPLRHIGIYAYRAGFLQQYAAMSASPLESCESLEQLRVLWHGYPIAVEVLAEAPPAGVDTPADLDRVRREWAA